MLTTDQLKITQPQIAAYLCGKSDRDLQAYILKVKAEDPLYQLLFELIDKLMNHVIISETISTTAETPITFSAIDDILLRLFSDKITPETAQRFLEELRFNPVFYQQLMTRLTAATAPILREDIPELAQVQVKTDDAILKELVTEACREGQTIGFVMKFKQLLAPVVDAWKNLKQFVIMPGRWPRYAVAVPVVIFCFLITFLVYKKFIKEDIYEEYVYDDKVPYEYNMSGLRGSPNGFENDARFNVFVRQFKLGMSDYLMRDYLSAIQLLKKADVIIIRLQANLNDQGLVPWIRDLYFYQGLSYLALSRKQNLDKIITTQYAHKSIQFLSRADSLVENYNLENHDKEIYFLGLAYALSDNKELALAQLQKIKPECQFYQDKNKLIKFLIKKQSIN